MFGVAVFLGVHCSWVLWEGGMRTKAVIDRCEGFYMAKGGGGVWRGREEDGLGGVECRRELSWISPGAAMDESNLMSVFLACEFNAWEDLHHPITGVVVVR